MNIKISTFADRVNGLVTALVESDGRVLKSRVTEFMGTNIKDNAIEAVTSGLRLVKGIVKHDDLLIVEVQNQHLASWISGRVEYKDYDTLLDKLFEVLESIDCRYKVVCVPNSYAKQFGLTNGVTKKEYTSVENLLGDLEG